MGDVEKMIEDFTRNFLLGMGIDKYDLVPSGRKYREFSVYKLFASLEPGDHFAVWKKTRGFWHHGIYFGDDGKGTDCVIDITQEHGVALRPYDLFIDDEDAAIIIDYDIAFSKSTTLDYAKFVVKHAEVCPIRYNLAGRSCDMLASMLRTGKSVPNAPIIKNPKPNPNMLSKKASYSIYAKFGSY